MLDTELRYTTRRQETRAATAGKVVAEVADFGREGLVFGADIIDISPCGLRLETDVHLSVGALDVWVEIDGYPVNLFLSTEVRWTSLSDEGRFVMGVEIVDNEDTDVDEWCAFQREAWFEHRCQGAA